MKSKILPIFAFAAGFGSAGAQVVINEVRIDDPSGDTHEYFELYNTGADAVSLVNYSYIVIGDGASGSGTIESVLSLPDVSLAAGDYFLVANSTELNIDADGDGTAELSAIPDLAGASLVFENGDNVTHLLVENFTGLLADDLDTDDDGTLDVNPWSSVVDAVSLVATPDSGDEFYASTLGGQDVGPNGTFVPAHVFRGGDGGATWLMGDFGSELADDPVILQNTKDTPGGANPPPLTLSLVLSPNVIDEDDDFGASTGTVSIDSSLDVDLEITISSSDESEAIAGSSVTIFAGDTSETFQIDAIDDGWPDGSQDVTIAVTASGAIGAEALLTVNDDSDAYTLVINEVYYGDVGEDANQDGTVDDADQFIEIVNVTESPIDLSGYYLVENAGTDFSDDGIHRFREGTVLDPDCAIVVFGGGVTDGTLAGMFGTAQVTGSSRETNSLFLSGDGNDFVTLLDDSDAEVFSMDLPVPPELGESLNLAMDLVPGSYTSHSGVSPFAETFSPGTFAEGGPFCDVTDALSISFSSSSVSEEDGEGVATATVTLPSAASSDVTVTLFSGNPSKLLVNDGFEGLAEVSGVISAGSSQVSFPLDAVNNSTADGTIDVELVALASNYLNGNGSLEITDPSDTSSAADIVFTQYYEGSSNNKHVEITNIGSSTISLDGWSLTRWSNDTTEDWKTATGGAGGVYDLSEITLEAGQTIVISNSSAVVPEIVSDYQTGIVNHNGNDSLVIYSGPIDPANIVDVLSFTETGNEGADTSYVRLNSGTGWNTNAGSNITDFASVWAAVDLETVENAATGDTNYLGFYAESAVSDYSVSISSISNVAGTVTIDFSATGLSDVYRSTDLQTWTIQASDEGISSGTYVDEAPLDADETYYLIQEAGADAPTS
ncbi:MAG: lamin tail domain-containing protein [Verrucomicrobiota bacterium JB023]|nr:lamin tail domain-containing protein [Verrucomicrobiota bacterium JB023]